MRDTLLAQLIGEADASLVNAFLLAKLKGHNADLARAVTCTYVCDAIDGWVKLDGMRLTAQWDHAEVTVKDGEGWLVPVYGWQKGWL